MRHPIVLCCILHAWFAGGCKISCVADETVRLAPGDPAIREAALSRAVTFLEFFEADDYEAAHGLIVKEWRSNTSLPEWREQIARLRRMAGSAPSREPSNGGFAEKMPDGRPCNCFVFVFKAESGKKVAGVTVTLREEDGDWYVAGMDVDARTSTKIR